MANWNGSTRRSRLPKNWKSIRARVFRRDGYRCVIPLPNGVRCPGAAEECDHIFAGDNHDLANLQSLCHYHHSAKSGREGAAASQARKQQIANRFPKPDM